MANNLNDTPVIFDSTGGPTNLVPFHVYLVIWTGITAAGHRLMLRNGTATGRIILDVMTDAANKDRSERINIYADQGVYCSQIDSGRAYVYPSLGRIA